jgi:hypothetical protein
MRRKNTLKADPKVGILKVMGTSGNGVYYAKISLGVIVLGLVRMFIHYALYQRPRLKQWVNALSASFDPLLAREPRLSFRNGKLYCMDGAHTIAAMMLKGLKTVNCMVYTNLTYQREAYNFFSWNTKFKEVKGWVNFFAREEYGDPIVGQIMDVVHSHKLTLPRDRGVAKPRHADMCNVSTLNDAYKLGGLNLLSKVCKALSCWKVNGHLAAAAKNVEIQRGLTKFLYETDASMRAVCRVLQEMSPEAIRRIAAKMPSKGRIDAPQMNMAFHSVVNTSRMMKAA